MQSCQRWQTFQHAGHPFSQTNFSKCHNLPYYFITFSFSIYLVIDFPAHCYILGLSMKEMIWGQSLEIFVFNTTLIDITFNFCFPFVIKQCFFNRLNCKYLTVVFVLMLLVEYFWKKILSAPIQPARAWEVKRCKACHIIPKKTWGWKGASTKCCVKGMNTYAMYLFQFLLFTEFAKLLQICFWFCHYGVWSVDWCEKVNLKHFNVRQQYKMCKNEGVWILSQGTLYICVCKPWVVIFLNI